MNCYMGIESPPKKLGVWLGFGVDEPSWAARQVQSPAEHARLEILALGGVHRLMGPMPKGLARESATKNLQVLIFIQHGNRTSTNSMGLNMGTSRSLFLKDICIYMYIYIYPLQSKKHPIIPLTPILPSGKLA